MEDSPLATFWCPVCSERVRGEPKADRIDCPRCRSSFLRSTVDPPDRDEVDEVIEVCSWDDLPSIDADESLALRNPFEGFRQNQCVKRLLERTGTESVTEQSLKLCESVLEMFVRLNCHCESVLDELIALVADHEGAALLNALREYWRLRLWCPYCGEFVWMQEQQAEWMECPDCGSGYLESRLLDRIDSVAPGSDFSGILVAVFRAALKSPGTQATKRSVAALDIIACTVLATPEWDLSISDHLDALFDIVRTRKGAARITALSDYVEAVIADS